MRNNQRDGFHRTQIDHGRTSYFPNTLGLGCPALAPGVDGGYVHYPEPVEGLKIRRAQREVQGLLQSGAAVLSTACPTPEKRHLIDAARFELGRVESPVVRQRMVALFDLVDRELADARRRAHWRAAADWERRRDSRRGR